MAQPIDLIDAALFWARVDQSTGPEGCWPWIGRLDRYGYGEYQKRVSHGAARKRYQWRAHRVAYELLVGPIPEGLQLDHLCRVRRCCNPAHLEPVTPEENSHRGRGHPRLVMAEACPNGHPYVPGSFTVRNGRWRVCKQCAAARRRRHQLAL